jgi:RNA polymerase sigma factor (sigma-70 family)
MGGAGGAAEGGRPMTYSDIDPYDDLVRAFREGRDPDRERLRKALCEIERFIVSKSPDLRPKAGELMLDTIARAYEKIDRFRGESQFMTWVKGIAVNVIREYRRDRDNQSILVSDELLEKAELGSDGADENPEDRAIHELAYTEAIGLLSEDERRAVMLRFGREGLMPFKDVGAECGITSIEARRLVYKALPKMRRYWTENGW